MRWHMSWRADPAARQLADRHYSRQKVGAAQFVQAGSCVVFLTKDQDALWVTSFPIAQYVKHAWAGAWQCSIFRNEGNQRASELIREAVAATRAHYGDPPDLGMVTFIDTAKVRPILCRGIPTWGRTYRLAGFAEVGETKAGLRVFQLRPHDMPDAVPALPRCGSLL